jgi:hypothetical protein
VATGAFGSLMQMVHSTKPRSQTQASIGTRIVRAAKRVRLFAGDSNLQSNGRIDNKSNRVSLRSEDGTFVGEGVLDVNFTTGMVLNGVKLFPNEVAVQVTRIWKPSHWIGETSCPTLSEGLGHVIQWKSNLVSCISEGQGSSTGQNQGQYHRRMENASLSAVLSCASATYDYPSRTPSPIGTPPFGTQSLSTTSISPFVIAPYLTHLGDASGSIGNLPFVDGLGVQRIVCAYCMVQQTQKPHPLCQRGQSRSKKVELLSVEEAIRTGGCK